MQQTLHVKSEAQATTSNFPLNINFPNCLFAYYFVTYLLISLYMYSPVESCRVELNTCATVPTLLFYLMAQFGILLQRLSAHLKMQLAFGKVV